MAPSDVWGQSEEFVLSWEAAEGEGEALTACENLDLDHCEFWVGLDLGVWLWPISNLICLARVSSALPRKRGLI